MFVGTNFVGLDWRLAYSLTFVDIVAASCRLLQPVANLPEYDPHDDQLFLMLLLHYIEFYNDFIVQRCFHLAGQQGVVYRL